MATKHYTETTGDFVYEWGQKWKEIVNLILYLVSHFESPPYSPPPTNSDEIKYQSFRPWFIDRESQFIPLWKDFYEEQDWALDPGDEELAEMPDCEKFLENPFHFAYRPENLYRLMVELDIQSGTEIWEPNRERAWTACVELVTMNKVLTEFIYWIFARIPGYLDWEVCDEQDRNGN